MFCIILVLDPVLVSCYNTNVLYYSCFRPSASFLLSHPFLRNLRKKSTSVLPSLLHPVTPLLDASKLPKGKLLHPVTPLLDASKLPKGKLLHPVIPLLDASKLPKGKLLHPVIPLLDASKLPKGKLLYPVTPLLDASKLPKGKLYSIGSTFL